MVFSKIDHKVEYREAQEIHESDWNHESALYRVEIEGKSVVVALGKPCFEFARLIYFRIYLVSRDNKIEGQLGVFEVSNYGNSDGDGDGDDVLSQLFDQDKDPNIHVFEEPLLFYFAPKLVEATTSTAESYLLRHNEAVAAEARARSAAAERRAEDAEQEAKAAREKDTDKDGEDKDEDKGEGGGEGAAKRREHEVVDQKTGSVVFFLQADAVATDMPGEGKHERIKRAQMLYFVDLIRNMKRDNWRAMLDDAWDRHPFEVDGKRWKSVVHYVQGCKFKREHPAFYRKFCLDSESNISGSVALALSAGSPSGVHEAQHSRQENVLLRDREVGVDTEFDGREARERALFAKFDQHRGLKLALLATQHAQLTRRPAAADRAAGKADEIGKDHELMALRSKLQP